MARRKGRGRLSSIELLPDECSPIIAWAAEELSRDDRTQQDIYEEFYTRLGNLMADSHGELEFNIPSRSSFNRYSMNQAALRRRIDETRRIANAIAGSFDASDSDDLALIAAESLKTLVFELLSRAGEAGMTPKDAMQLSTALKGALQAQSISTQRRQKIEAQFAEKAEEVVDAAARKNGWSKDTADKVLAGFLGVDVGKVQ